MILASCAARNAPAENDADADRWYFNESTFVVSEDRIGNLVHDAESLAAEGRYEDAVLILGEALERGGNGLYRQDHRRYRSLPLVIETIVRDLPAAALKAYREQFEPQAREAFRRASESSDMNAMSAALRKYFITGIGDDYAFRFASRLIDRGDFVQAEHLLERIRNRHPDPSIDRHLLSARLAVCAARTDRPAVASRWLAAVRKEAPGGDEAMARLLNALEAELNASRQRVQAKAAGAASWPRPFGDETGAGVMPANPQMLQNTDAAWVPYWRVSRMSGTTPWGTHTSAEGPFGGDTRVTTEAYAAMNLVSSTWPEGTNRPASSVHWTENRFLLRTLGKLVCLDENGRQTWPQPVRERRPSHFLHTYPARGNAFFKHYMFHDFCSATAGIGAKVAFFLQNNRSASEALPEQENATGLAFGNRLTAVDVQTGSRRTVPHRTSPPMHVCSPYRFGLAVAPWLPSAAPTARSRCSGSNRKRASSSGRRRFAA